MEPHEVSDAATYLEGGLDERTHSYYLLYDVHGWIVRLSASQLHVPWGGPDRLEIQPGTTATSEGIELVMPTDGLTTEVLRAVPLAHARKQLRRLRFAAREPESGPVVKDRLETVEDWAQFAKVYAEAAVHGHRQPVQYLAARTGMSRNTLSARVRRARAMGLLTRPTPQGLGSLTEQAKSILGETTGEADDG